MCSVVPNLIADAQFIYWGWLWHAPLPFFGLLKKLEGNVNEGKCYYKDNLELTLIYKNQDHL